MATTYCNRVDITSIIGDAAVLACIDDNANGTEEPGETLHITAAIERAAVDMNSALGNQYKISDLAGNAWCKWCNAYIACWYLYARKSNPQPGSIIEAVQTYKDQLAEARWGRWQIPEQNPSFEHIPTVSNFQPELGKRVAPIRVDREESTGSDPVGNRKRNPAKIPGWW